MRVAIYCRLSEEDRVKLHDDDDSNSIQNQKTMLMQHAYKQGWDIYDIYSDDDYAGADRNRPEFNRLLKDAEAKNFDIILCKTQSRFTREIELVEKYIHGLFPIWGIRFISIVDNADTTIKGNKKSRQINGLVNEWYLEDLSENIKSVLTNRRQNGFHIGAFAPFGYRKDPNLKGHLIIDEEAAAIVREIFNLFLAGYGKTAIARILNSRGIPNPTQYKRIHGDRRKDAQHAAATIWKNVSVSDILKNEVYIGNLVQGRYASQSFKTRKNVPVPKDKWIRVEHTHEPIISADIWEQTQALLKARTKPFDVSNRLSLFARKTKCAHCGYTLRSTKQKDRRYYVCPNHYISKASCPGASIPERALECIILDEIRRLNVDYLNTDDVAMGIKFNESLLKRKAKLQEELHSYERKISEKGRAIRDLYMDKVKGIISENDFMALTNTFRSDKEQAEQLIIEIQKQLDEIEQRLDESDNRKEVVERYVSTLHLTREMVDELIDYVVVGRRIPNTQMYPVEIHWNF